MLPTQRRHRPLLAGLTAAALAAGGIASAATLPAALRPGGPHGPGAAAFGLPAVKHVWIVVLENKSYAESFSPTTQAPYLIDLASKGALLQQYYGVAHFSLPNYIALVSGQGPNPVTQTDCPPYLSFIGTSSGPDGQALGQGCVYPAAVKTVADQLSAAGRSWKGYMEDLAADPARQTPDCGIPAIHNGTDTTQTATVKDQYAARHNPFVYFHSLTDGACKGHIVGTPQLIADAASSSTTPAYAFVTPNLCNDGHDSAHCIGTDVAGGHAHGLAAVDLWLRAYIPAIIGSPAYRDGGMLVIAWDEAGTGFSSGASSSKADGTADASSCCNEHVANTPLAAGASGIMDINGAISVSGTGGGRTGAIVLSPFVKPGTVSNTPYNHYSLLRTVEDLYGLSHLGYAGQATGVNAFGSDVFTARAVTPTKTPTKTPITAPTKQPTTPVTAPGRGLAATGLGTFVPILASLFLLAAVGLRRRAANRS